MSSKQNGTAPTPHSLTTSVVRGNCVTVEQLLFSLRSVESSRVAQTSRSQTTAILSSHRDGMWQSESKDTSVGNEDAGDIGRDVWDGGGGGRGDGGGGGGRGDGGETGAVEVNRSPPRGSEGGSCEGDK